MCFCIDALEAFFSGQQAGMAAVYVQYFFIYLLLSETYYYIVLIYILLHCSMIDNIPCLRV